MAATVLAQPTDNDVKRSASSAALPGTGQHFVRCGPDIAATGYLHPLSVRLRADAGQVSPALTSAPATKQPAVDRRRSTSRGTANARPSR